MEENMFAGNGTAAAAAAASAADSTTYSPSGDEGEFDYVEWIMDMIHTGVFENQIIITKVISMLSAMGSAYIFVNMIMDARRSSSNKLERTFDRLLLGLCVSDCISSISLFLGSW